LFGAVPRVLPSGLLLLRAPPIHLSKQDEAKIINTKDIRETSSNSKTYDDQHDQHNNFRHVSHRAPVMVRMQLVEAMLPKPKHCPEF
jgi:hypothetical protein